MNRALPWRSTLLRRTVILSGLSVGLFYLVAGASALYSLVFLAGLGQLFNAVALAAALYLVAGISWMVSIAAIFQRKNAWFKFVVGTCILSIVLAAVSSATELRTEPHFWSSLDSVVVALIAAFVAWYVRRTNASGSRQQAGL